MRVLLANDWPFIALEMELYGFVRNKYTILYTVYCNSQGTSPTLSSYETGSDFLLPGATLLGNGIIGDCQYGLCPNRPTIDYILYSLNIKRNIRV
jgi:hypothetical protein